MADELYEDVQAASRFTQALSVPDRPDTSNISAIEEGHRERPDGTTEDYRRIEFDRKRG